MKMKFIYISLFLIIAGMSFQSCKDKENHTAPAQDSAPKQETIIADTALYGKLGESTGMSCVEIITNQGDTLTLNKVNEHTGEAGLLLGGTEHYNDALTITTDANKESIVTLVNINTLCRKWFCKTDSLSLSLQEDKLVKSDWKEKDYTSWTMCNAKLVLNNKELVSDTFSIQSLNQDSLIIRGKQNTIKFYSK